jgi:BirA family biotin operon repressor/biotin-[acetyl-CoA-carboxylase] ligase
MKSLPRKTLEILSDGQFHSGEELGKSLGITRSAVWKIINQLTKLDIDIISLKGKGYKIPAGFELLNEKKIEKHLTKKTKSKIIAISIFDSIDSTNQYLLDQIQTGIQPGNVCLAEHQTSGRGRRGRHWHSPFGANLYLSLLWEFSKDSAEISGLSLATAIAVTRALKQYGINTNIGLKWPNDVLWSKRKLGGVLLEMVTESHGNTQVVIGIGLNLNMPKTTAINQAWTDLKTITGKSTARNELVALLLNELIDMLIQFEIKGLIPFIPEWEKLDIAHNSEVTVKIANQEIRGIVSGISERGELIITDAENQVRKFLSGEVSLRLMS